MYCGFINNDLPNLDPGLEDCLHAIHKAHILKWLDFDTFDLNQYEYYEQAGRVRLGVRLRVRLRTRTHTTSRCEG